MYISYHIDRDSWRTGNYFAYSNNWHVFDVQEWWQLEKIVTNFCWSPCVWQKIASSSHRSSQRQQRNFVFADLIALDFDSGETTLEEAISNKFADMICMIGTTKSHQSKEKPWDRFRVILLPGKRLNTVDDYRATCRHEAEFYGSDCAATDGARWFAPCKQVVHTNQEGEWIENIAAQKSAPDTAYEAARIQTGKIERWMRSALTYGVEVGRKQNMAYAIALEGRKLGWSKDRTFQTIWSSPIPLNHSDKVKQEIEKQVNSAFRR